jgi:hypothetical protein
MHRILAGSLVALLALAITGCAAPTSVRVTVDGMAAPEAKSAVTYRLFPAIEGITENSLEWREYTAYLHTALAERGFKRVPPDVVPDMAILVWYGISEPQQEHYSYSVPIFGQTGVSSSTTYGTLSTFGTTSTYSGTTTYTPTYGVVGATTHTGTHTIYTRGLDLVAMDLAHYLETGEPRAIWQTTLMSTGSSGDLRRIFPFLVAAAKPYFGTDTGRQIVIDLTESDEAVVSLTGGDPTQGGGAGEAAPPPATAQGEAAR